MRIAAVTGLYDVGRAGIDGRSINDYIEWLNLTLTVPLPFLVFLDPTFDAGGIRLKPGDRIVRVSRDEFTAFRHRKTIEQICATSEHVNRRDIAFKLPDYGMLVMSKLGMMKRAGAETDADGLIWIDAGLSRFLPDLRGATPKLDPAELDGLTIGVNATQHLAQHIGLGRLPHRMVGTCLTLVSGGDFYVARSFAKELSDRLDFMLETEWLPNGRWDNEQVALGCLLFRGGLPQARIVSTTVGWANVTRWLFGLPIHDRPVPAYVRWRFFVDHVRTLSTPKSRCYLPGDFPNEAFRALSSK